MTALENARKAAEAAAAKLAEVESAEAAKAAQKASERDARQREKDTEFLSKWESLDAELMEVGSKSAVDAVYEGADPISAIAVFWGARSRRNAVRTHARNAFFRIHGQHPDEGFARELAARDMMIADQLENAIAGAAARHGADLAEALEVEWLVS
ncbi:hypothetical protein [Streptomyces erythrochromogenes]|uniref:hypothetical protein n=1 Tax=Streptomyces erythrochromogenes TaxID=285574 RepID=UPI0038253884